MNRFLAPVLSAQFMTDATGKQLEILTLVPDLEPLPLLLIESFVLINNPM